MRQVHEIEAASAELLASSKKKNMNNEKDKQEEHAMQLAASTTQLKETSLKLSHQEKCKFQPSPRSSVVLCVPFVADL